jgi:hypothetical protein
LRKIRKTEQMTGFPHFYIFAVFLSLFNLLNPGEFDQAILKSRALARTENGYLALVPKGAQPGDSIALLKGGKIPFVVREADGEGGLSLVGDSYVHGIMNGEAFEEIV